MASPRAGPPCVPEAAWALGHLPPPLPAARGQQCPCATEAGTEGQQHVSTEARASGHEAVLPQHRRPERLPHPLRPTRLHDHSPSHLWGHPGTEQSQPVKLQP